MGGRGSGKTRAGAEWLRAQAESGRRGRFALVGPTYADVRNVMIEGESGLLAIAPRDQRPVFESSRGRLIWPNGAQAFAFSAESLEGLRGPQFHAAWCDEYCYWKNGETVLSTLDMALRLGAAPRVVITTTPKAIPALRKLLASPDLALTHMSTRENLANLAPGFWGIVSRRYGGTKLARQELEGELIDDDAGALFKRTQIENDRIYPQHVPDLQRVIVAVDPSAGTGGKHNDECGIVVAGLGVDGRAYVLGDWSLKAASPSIWAQKAMRAYKEFKADGIIAEANQGGVYDGRMIATDRTALWCWDSRPYPDFPARNEVWGDAANWRLGHWLTGRLGLAPLADVVVEICRRAGLEHIDAAALDGVVSGFALNDPTSARQALTALCAAYGFDLVPQGEGLAAIRHGAAPRASLNADDFALTDSKAPRFERTRLDPNAAPVEARVRFYEPSRDYMVGAVSARRKDGAQEGVVSLDLPLSFDGAQAEAVAWRALAEARAARDQVDCALPARLLHLSPGDVVDLNLDGGEGAAFQIDSLVEGAVRRARLIRASDAAGMPSSGGAPSAGAPAPYFAPPDVALIDSPFAAGAQDWQILAAARAEPWPGAMRVYAGASNESQRLIGRIEAPAAMGELLEGLPAGRFGIWQEDAQLRLSLRGASLQSATKRQVLNGANLLAVERAPDSHTGGWEFLQFREALLVGVNEWILSGLLRGQFGMDDRAQGATPAGARVVLVDDRLARLSLAESERGLALQWRAGAAGRDKFSESYAAQELIAAGRALRPWSPCHLRAARQPGGDIRMYWVRRARWGGDSWEGLDPPLSEETEIYQVSIFDGGILKRRLESATPEATYALADQIEDHGGPVPTLQLEVTQLSNRAGLGISRSGLIAVD